MFVSALVLFTTYVAFSSRKMPEITDSLNVTRLQKEEDDFRLAISKIGVAAPITERIDWKVENEYLQALQKGLIHLKGTSLPDEIGNVVITGHSSTPYIGRGNYDEVFARLPELTEGDMIDLWFQDKKQTYEVTETKIVEETDIGILSDSEESRLTLFTCYPIGTNEKRFVVIAKKVD